jgi:crescentin
MAKLSDIFSRKSASASVEKLTPRSRNGNGSGGDHISFDSPSDIGSRMGEENEILRTLLTDTGRKISELDEPNPRSTSWLRRSTARCARSSRKNHRR